MSRAPPIFFVDSCCLRLAKLLRSLGFDTRSETCISDRTIVLLAKKENRILVTQDLTLAKEQRSIIDGVTLHVFTKVLDPFLQLKEIVQSYHLKLDEGKYFTRCTACNCEFQTISKAEAKGHVPEGIYELKDVFYKCWLCNKYFWNGSHKDTFREVIQSKVYSK